MIGLLKRAMYPLVSFATVFLIWEVSVRAFHVPNYILPDLSQIVKALQFGYIEGHYWQHFWFTLRATFMGYCLGTLLAITFGALLAEVSVVDRFIYPLIVAVQSMPKVALAPLIIVWFGFGIESKIVMVALICFFPIFVNVMNGLKSIDHNLVDMMRICGCSRFEILWQAKLPHAAGSIFAGMQIAVVLGLIGAVVGEFIASTQGLGFLIQAGSNALELGTVFAGLVSLSFIGICGTQLLRVLQSRIVFWERKTSSSIGTAES